MHFLFQPHQLENHLIMSIFKSISVTVLAWFLSSYDVTSCRCRYLSFTEEVNYADQIFTGTVLKKNPSDLIQYTFVVSQTFKGNKTDSITLNTGFGGGDCGMKFVVGKTYLVYSREGHTSICRRNALLEETTDIDQLKKLFPRRR